MHYFGLLLSFLLEYLRPGTHFPWMVTIKLGTVVPITVFVLTVLGFHGRSREVWGTKESKLLIFFILLVALSFFTAYQVQYVEPRLLASLGYYFMFFMIAVLCDSIKKIKRIFVLLIAVHIILVILNPGIITDPTTRTYIRDHTFLGDGNDFALSVTMLFPMCMFLVKDAQSKLAKNIWMVCAIVLFLAIIGSQSRGASLSLAAMLFYLWLKSNQKLLGIFAALVLGFVVLLYATPQYFSRMATLADPLQESSANKRTIFWEAGFDMAVKHPLTGVGAGNFNYAFGTRFSPQEGLGFRSAHSLWFTALGELGFPGLIIIVLYLFGMYRRNEREIKKVRAGSELSEIRRFEYLLIYLSASLVSFLVGSTFLSVLYYPHLYVLGGLNIAAIHLYRKRLEYLTKQETCKDDEKY